MEGDADVTLSAPKKGEGQVKEACPINASPFLIIAICGAEEQMGEGIDYAKILDAVMVERANMDALVVWLKRKIAESNSGDSVTIDTLLRDRPENPPQKPSERIRHPRLKSDTFFKMSVIDAIEECLKLEKRPLTAKEITDALQSGGLTHKAKDLYQTVFPTLGRMKDRGIVEKLPTGEWGLAAWYERKAPQAEPEE